MTIKIITDSCCDLPLELAEELGLEIIPVLVTNGDNEFRDQIDIQPKTVYEGMRNGQIYKTAQITPQVFAHHFSRYAENGDQAIYIGFSSELSSTFQSAVMARQYLKESYPDFDLEIIDTKAASGGVGLIVYETAKAAKNGASKENLLKILEFYINNCNQIFTVDDIEYLYRGGRVSKTSAILGGMLNIKPILEVNNGKLVLIEKVRGRAKVFKRMLELVEERNIDKDFSKRTFVIAHGDDLEGAEKLRNMIEEKFGVKNFLVIAVGAVIGAHSGPGTLCVFYSSKNMS